MTNPMSKPALARKVGIPIVLASLVGLKTVSADDSGTVQPDGMNHAKVGTDTVLRDPLWPVGYTPAWQGAKNTQEESATVKNEGSIDWNKAMEKVAIQGVSSRAGNEFYAVVNGQVRSAGETVCVEIGNVSYTWMIEGISPPSSVKLRRVSAE